MCDCNCQPCQSCDTKKEEHWLQAFWRPAMSWQYFVICLFDFLIAPIFLAVYTELRHIPYVSWIPLTLQGGGLYHVAMGAIIGVTSWSRGQEKVTAMNTPSMSSMPSGVTPIATPTPATQPVTPVVATAQQQPVPTPDISTPVPAPVKARRIAPLDSTNM